MALSNVKKTAFGNLKVAYGTWTFTEAGSTDSIAVEGGQIWLSQFTSFDSSGAIATVPRSSISTSGNITTITIYGQEGVTTGTFLVIYS